MAAPTTKTFIVEHLDPDLEAWSSLEYAAIARESRAACCRFILSSVPDTQKLPESLTHTDGLTVEGKSVENLFDKAKVCLLDPAAEQELGPADGDRFSIFLFGGILGDDPPRDRTSELRNKGFEGRRLGPVQMTTDTAVRVTRMVVHGKRTLESISYIDHPEIRINRCESTEMPFRYVADEDGRPIMPEGMVELIKKDSDKGFGDLLHDGTTPL